MSPLVRFLAALLGLIALLVFADHAHGQDWAVELDLDGTPWNGPDHADVELSDLVEVDVWLNGPALPVFSYGTILYNLDGSLEYLGTISHHPDGWTPEVVFDSVSNQLTIMATDYDFAMPIFPPRRLATVTWHAAVDQSLDDLTIGDSAVFLTSFVDGIIDICVGATVRIGGTTATDRSSWGAVKGMFR